ncbi:CRISPR-associated protein Cas4 [Thauera chlorobenzoica]|uniref:CRISPR-associated exonuclease Cas4 n=1 Tax=Thauera chlorobenzoica TaxID=96773 RepID=A0A1H5XVC6_9RHOO|nr:CRISPR-associated protein Cas4 [Thauera chlorobenzoica]APR04314.1 CRISPR-associated RecB family exonuclease Cas4 [Thauera chlorobenzoica]SEG15681.1 CRISPR-associated exonuclease, Cas4 family [Thauera chlorobenzoica]
MDEDDPIPISALQHFLYCPRQCALIHVERLWAENRHTAEGRLLHDRADKPMVERRHGVRTVTAMPLSNAELGIAGVADAVEFHSGDEGECPYPVEYKRGRPKAHRADEVQLCAQALCLEAMFGVKVVEGALFYGTPRRRQVVVFDDALRSLTLAVIRDTRVMIDAGRTPTATYDVGRCDACSLIDLCQPRLLARAAGVEGWLRRQLKHED